ncbi:glycosyltransferase family 4 protein [Stieleria sp. JC731]|uniref:glycosyltransferase family 4 protein n=1 Tax=Pirellulaceae TaxID=2691357 RepID=UPI001E6584B4|nr:glycosyltransferase family 4 protein [Stieleria sp. JC731]MCC9599512.1 glycosyltransferase family 4 protein [Stieleria sp. JC731]
MKGQIGYPRLCVASCGLGRVARGIEAWANDLGYALHKRGHSVLLCKGSGERHAEFERVVPCWPRDAKKTQRLVQAIPHGIGWRFGLGSGYGVEQQTFSRRLIRVLRQERIDVLHVQDPFVATAVQKANLRGQVSTKVILAHGTEEPIGFQSRVTYLQHLAPWHHEQAQKAGVDRATWVTIPNFIDVDHFYPGRSDQLRRELEIPPGQFVVLVVAAIKRRHKRIDYLLGEFKALASSMPDAPITFVIAGGQESDTAALIAMGTELLGDRVRFLVGFPRERMPELYRMADVFVLGSLKEMMPIALLEATASGLPCVVHQHPVMSWMVAGGGLSLDMTRQGVVTESLHQLLHQPEQLAELGAVARSHCCSQFGTDAVVDQLLEYYRFVAKDQKVAA